MQIAFKCPDCGAELEVDSTAMGSQIDCPQCSKAVMVPLQKVGPGCTLKGFRIDALLGKGGMGEVYLAHQLSMDRRVALKILPAQFTRESENVDRFLKEVRMAARLAHPHVVSAYEAGEDGGVYFLAMAYVEGENLAERLKRQGWMKEADALKILRDVAEALAYAWDEHRIIHRDIKPANIMIDRRGRTQLMDLGLSKSVAEESGLTMTGTVMGTPNYMSPEQAEGRSSIDFRADMYSLGATLYQMLTGIMPFAGSSLMEVLRKQLTESLPDPRQLNPEVSESCVLLMERMLAKNADDRYATWEELIADIGNVLANGAPAGTPLEQGSSVLIRTRPGTSRSSDEKTVLERRPEPEASKPQIKRPAPHVVKAPIRPTPPVAQIAFDAVTIPDRRPTAEQDRKVDHTAPPAKRRSLVPAAIAAGFIAIVALIGVLSAASRRNSEQGTGTAATPPPTKAMTPAPLTPARSPDAASTIDIGLSDAELQAAFAGNPPPRLGPFTVRRILGRGTKGTAIEVHDEAASRIAVLKVHRTADFSAAAIAGIEQDVKTGKFFRSGRGVDYLWTLEAFKQTTTSATTPTQAVSSVQTPAQPSARVSAVLISVGKIPRTLFDQAPPYIRSVMETWPQVTNGVYVISGPAGSGKGTLLLSLLTASATKANATVLDIYPGSTISQQLSPQVLPANGRDMAQLVRTTPAEVRPDFVLVEDPDDPATVRAVLEQAKSRLVFVSVATNEAASAPRAIIELGAAPKELAGVLHGVFYQCRMKSAPGGVIQEAFNVTPAIRSLIAANADPADIRRTAIVQGMVPYNQGKVPQTTAAESPVTSRRESTTSSPLLPPLATPANTLESLGVRREVCDVVRAWTQATGGVYAIVGPAGSGKTTTALAVAKQMAGKGRQLVQLKTESIRTPADADPLRGLQGDPPLVIFADFIAETNTFALAALMDLPVKGHFVVLQFDAAYATEVPERLVAAGVSRKQAADSLAGAIAQRLFPRKGGGRAATMEILTVTSPLRDLISKGASAADIRAAAEHEGFVTLQKQIREMVAAGNLSTNSARAHPGDFGSP